MEETDQRRFMDWLAFALGAAAVGCLLGAGYNLAAGHRHTATMWALIAMLFGLCWGFAWVGSNLGAVADGSYGSKRHSRRKANIAISLLTAYGLGHVVYLATGDTLMTWGTLPFVAAIVYFVMTRVTHDGV